MQQNKILRYMIEESKYQDNPTEVFYRLCHNKSNTLLLESSTVIDKKAVESMMIVDSALRITARNNCVSITALTNNGKFLLIMLDNIFPRNIQVISTPAQRKIIFPYYSIPVDEEKKLMLHSVFDIFRFIIKSISSYEQKKTIFFGGLFSYDLINSFEILPLVEKKHHCPDFCFYLAENLVLINHKKKTTTIQTNIFTSNAYEYIRLKNRMLSIQKRLNSEIKTMPSVPIHNMKVTYDIHDMEYAQVIKKMKKFITQGDIFQVVPSRKFYLPCTHSLSAYHALKQNNPSPYMFFMQDIHFQLFGASPESYLKYNPKNRIVEIHPIAGTRSRGKNKDGSINLDLDNRIELSLRTNQKELSEHLMLVDLARNDLAKVCSTGSRYVSQLMKVEKYSHVMHLVSNVIGTLSEDLDIFHAYQSCMNMGTLTGAPKIRAMQLIAQIEKNSRGSYGGSIGYFTGEELFDMCIIIRSAYVENNIATVQTGAGIVLDSIPFEEIQESKNKAYAVLLSIFQSHHAKGTLYV
ncbi:anthranilate synthase component 1 [Buchnera aphidicola]|uniref:anthranilate synthase component 1 n=1 Tax=Buchnera aphidicola TaxID=9 RepID=UPI00094C6A55|nr:anthranilate synthase component 1 [Buchnera aphidicola]